MHIGKKIRDIRESLSLSDDIVARRLKIRRKTLWQIERTPYLNNRALQKIAIALGVELADIIS